MQTPESPERQGVLEYSGKRGRFLLKGMKIVSLLWKWLIDPKQAVIDEDADATTRCLLDTELAITERLNMQRWKFGDGILIFLPDNTATMYGSRFATL